MRAGRIAALGLAFFLACLVPVAAQDPAQPLRSPILTIDQERLFTESRAGQALVDALEADSAALAAENRLIEAQLIAEERELTERRAQMPPEEFRALAETFDEKVVAIRRAQDAKARTLAQRSEADQQTFYRRALPLVAEIVRERGAVVVLERGAVILSAEQVDITDEAISVIDARLAPPDADQPAPDVPGDTVPAPE
ncbi:OmpH family outer membrane protein [Rhodovulum euryhalinum]|uniref:Periplasmic chaperone for outer membrane proteins Skp n=1 Tax=Rhodovulum euryhalinum TaxID=35805 RepID=A0A4R2K8R8_9RHOB|nr:OmpH family outer membrane protein [Rhodovulum euryhalinum]TCO69773.1 periplasmic chaperone for outer membrane proteins Skp [Rhodovulum euryhalinum]